MIKNNRGTFRAGDSTSRERSVISESTIGGENQYHWIEQLCPICEAPPANFLGRRGGAAHRQRMGVECCIWRCAGCGLIFPNPMPIPVKGLEQHYGIDADDYFINHDLDDKDSGALKLLTEAEELIGSKGVVLDIGSGRGELLRAAKQQGWSAVGIELSPTFAEYASRYAGVEIRRESVESCGFASASFDVVILQAVLEHLYNPDETIKEISRILKPGGILYTDVPNEEGLYVRLGNFYQRLQRRDWVLNLSPTFSPFHVFGFGPRSLKALLAKHGLQPVIWRVGGGRSCIPARGGVVDKMERTAASLVTSISNMIGMGTYIATWARKVQT